MNYGGGVIVVLTDGVPDPEPTPEPESISISTNRASYEYGDTVIFSGKITNYDSSSGRGLTFLIVSPDNNIVTIGQLIPSSDGSFSKSIDTDNPLWKLDGDYVIEAHYGSLTADVEFEFETDDDYLPPIPDPEPDTQKELEILSLSTKKSKYKTGDTIVITGKVSTSDFSKPVLIQILKDGTIVDISEVTVTLGERFSKTVLAEFPAWKESGKYIIKAYYGNDVEETSFVFKATSSVPQPPHDNDPQSEITIERASGSGVPGCEDEPEGCFIPSVASVSLGGVVIMKNTDSAAHTFTAGTPSDGPSDVFESNLLIAGSSYEWTSDTEGVIPYFCMVHPWMQGIILVGEGTAPPRPDPKPDTRIDLDVSVNQRVYDLGDLASIIVEIDGISGSQKVAIAVTDPRGNSVVSRSLTFTSDGVDEIEFRIADDFKTGNYKVTATTSENGKTIKDTAHFKIKSQFNTFQITSVDVTNQQGNPSSLEAGQIGFIKVNLKSSKSIATLVTVNIFDADLTSIGIGSVKTTLSSGISEIILSFMIPEDVARGSANIYVNAFSDWPSNGGIPLTNEFSITELIGGVGN